MKTPYRFRSRLLLSAIALGMASAAFGGPAVRDPATEELQANQTSLASLEQRLKDTQAIPGLQKLGLKSEIENLLARIKTAHNRSYEEVLALRQPYNQLIARIEGMLGKDPTLARDIVAARDSIWDKLADRTQFASL